MNFENIPDTSMKSFFQQLEKEIELSTIPESNDSGAVETAEPEDPAIIALKAELANVTDSMFDLELTNLGLEAKNKELNESFASISRVASQYSKTIQQQKGMIDDLEKELKEAKNLLKPNMIAIEELINESHSLDKPSRKNLITSLQRLLAKKSGDIDAILSSELQSIDTAILDESDQEDEKGRTLKVVVATLYGIFKHYKIPSIADGTKLAALYSYLSGYSANTIRTFLSRMELSETNRVEVNKVNKLLDDINSEISIKI